MKTIQTDNVDLITMAVINSSPSHSNFFLVLSLTFSDYNIK